MSVFVGGGEGGDEQCNKTKLASFIVSAMIALFESTSPARRASNTASPNGLKHGTGVYSTT